MGLKNKANGESSTLFKQRFLDTFQQILQHHLLKYVFKHVTGLFKMCSSDGICSTLGTVISALWDGINWYFTLISLCRLPPQCIFLETSTGSCKETKLYHHLSTNVAILFCPICKSSMHLLLIKCYKTFFILHAKWPWRKIMSYWTLRRLHAYNWQLFVWLLQEGVHTWIHMTSKPCIFLNKRNSISI